MPTPAPNRTTPNRTTRVRCSGSGAPPPWPTRRPSAPTGRSLSSPESRPTGDPHDPPVPLRSLSYSAASHGAVRQRSRTVGAAPETTRVSRSDQAQFGWQPSVDAWLSCWDEQFSARLGDAGFLGGSTIPREYGGTGWAISTDVVVTEELLAAHRLPRTGLPTVRSVPACCPTERGAATPDPAQNRCGTVLSAIGMSEPQADRSRRRDGQGGPHRWRLAAVRHQGLDQRCPPGPSGRRARPHQPDGSPTPPRRFQPVHRAHRHRAGITVSAPSC